MTLYKWSQTANSNATIDSTVNWAEGQSPGSVNNSGRAMMAAVAKYRDDMAGKTATAGTAPTYTLTSNQSFTSLTDGLTVYFRCHATNTGSSGATLNVDSLGAKALRQFTGADLIAGRMLTGSVYGATYRLSTDEWLLHGSYVGPIDNLTPDDGGFVVGDGTNFVVESGATARSSIGLGTGNTPQFTGLEIGHASDTTVTRSAAGVLAVEGNDLAKTEPGINAQTGTTYTLVLTDKGKTVSMSNSSANTLTIPANASVAFPVGTIINVLRLGTGTTTIEGATGVTLNGVSAGSGDMPNQYQGVALTKVATDTWVASGDIEVVA